MRCIGLCVKRLVDRQDSKNLSILIDLFQSDYLYVHIYDCKCLHRPMETRKVMIKRNHAPRKTLGTHLEDSQLLVRIPAHGTLELTL